MRRFLGLLVALLIALPAVAGAMSHLWRCDQNADAVFALDTGDQGPPDGDCCPSGAAGSAGARGCASCGDCVAAPALLPSAGGLGVAEEPRGAAPAYCAAVVGAPPPGLPWRPPAA